MSVLTNFFPLQDKELRRLLAVHAPEPPQWFRPKGLTPEPPKPPRLIELEKEVNGAFRSDLQTVVNRMGDGGCLTALAPNESLTSMVLPPVREELEALQKAHSEEMRVWSRQAWELTYAQWPWFYADLVLGAEEPA